MRLGQDVGGAWHYSGDGPSRPFRSRTLGTIVIPTHYVSGGKAGSMTATESRPMVIHEVAHAPMGEAITSPRFELRAAGLSTAANLLNMQIADLDVVRAESNAADLELCPVCGPHPRRGA